MAANDKAARLLKEIDQIISSPGLHDNVSLQKKAIQLSKKLTVVLEEPANTAVDLVFTPYLSICARAAIDMQIFSALVQSDGPVSAFLRETAFASPSDPRDSVLQHAFQTKLSMFELLSTMPESLRDFNIFMGNTMDSSAALLVDIGGGKGHDLAAFHNSFGDQERLILQEQSHVIDSLSEADLPFTIECQTHDFFTSQPEKGARAYFLHQILHDWPDVKAIEILQLLKAAMKPGYSKILIHELILPDTGASRFASQFDIAMMTFSSGLERDRLQWIGLLQQAGLQVVDFLVNEDDADGIIEAILPKL